MPLRPHPPAFCESAGKAGAGRGVDHSLRCLGPKQGWRSPALERVWPPAHRAEGVIGDSGVKRKMGQIRTVKWSRGCCGGRMAGAESGTRLEALTPPPRWLQQGPITNLCKGSSGAAPQAQQDGDPWVRLPCCHDNHGCSGPSKRCAESKTARSALAKVWASHSA